MPDVPQNFRPYARDTFPNVKEALKVGIPHNSAIFMTKEDRDRLMRLADPAVLARIARQNRTCGGCGD